MKNIKKANVLWEQLCESVSKKPSPFANMKEREVIKHLRETREKLWEKKLATHS